MPCVPSSLTCYWISITGITVGIFTSKVDGLVIAYWVFTRFMNHDGTSYVLVHVIVNAVLTWLVWYWSVALLLVTYGDVCTILWYTVFLNYLSCCYFSWLFTIDIWIVTLDLFYISRSKFTVTTLNVPWIPSNITCNGVLVTCNAVNITSVFYSLRYWGNCFMSCWYFVVNGTSYWHLHILVWRIIWHWGWVLFYISNVNSCTIYWLTVFKCWCYWYFSWLNTINIWVVTLNLWSILRSKLCFATFKELVVFNLTNFPVTSTSYYTSY